MDISTLIMGIVEIMSSLFEITYFLLFILVILILLILRWSVQGWIINYISGSTYKNTKQKKYLRIGLLLTLVVIVIIFFFFLGAYWLAGFGEH